MRVGVIMMSAVLVCAIPQASRAQVSTPSENTVAIGGDVGFLGSGAESLDGGTGHVDAFVEYCHILSNDRHFAELDGATLSAFTWTFGLKVPF